jgi:hypothetical protein
MGIIWLATRMLPLVATLTLNSSALAEATQDVETFYCTWTDSTIPSEKHDSVVRVDYADKTVNGQPASISDSMIVLPNYPGEKSRVTINRMTGELRGYQGDHLYFYHGTCVR